MTILKKIQIDVLLLQFLEQIKQNGPVFKDHGICMNVIYLYRKTGDVDTRFLLDNRMNQIFRAWGNGVASIFPVEGAVQYKKDSDSGTLWDNPRRHELLDWSIGQLNEEVDKVRLSLKLKRILLECLHKTKRAPCVENEGIRTNVLVYAKDHPDMEPFATLDFLVPEYIDGELFGILNDRTLKISSYPVSSPNEYETEQKNGTVWKNPKRIELLNWLINHLENECEVH